MERRLAALETRWQRRQRGGAGRDTFFDWARLTEAERSEYRALSEKLGTPGERGWLSPLSDYELDRMLRLSYQAHGIEPDWPPEPIPEPEIETYRRSLAWFRRHCARSDGTLDTSQLTNAQLVRFTQLEARFAQLDGERLHGGRYG